MPANHPCILGVGSWQADDCLGWQVIERLHGRLPPVFILRAVKAPIDIIDSLTECNRLWIVDACISQDEPGTIHRCHWPSEQLAMLRWSSSHDLGVPAALQLASQLNLLPAQVVVWAVTVQRVQSGGSTSTEITQWVDRLVAKIVKECHQ